jgi:hypothetical protein
MECCEKFVRAIMLWEEKKDLAVAKHDTKVRGPIYIDDAKTSQQRGKMLHLHDGMLMPKTNIPSCLYLLGSIQLY